MGKRTLTQRIRGWLAERFFTLAGKLNESYDVWLDDAPRRCRECDQGTDPRTLTTCAACEGTGNLVDEREAT